MYLMLNRFENIREFVELTIYISILDLITIFGRYVCRQP